MGLNRVDEQLEAGIAEIETCLQSHAGGPVQVIEGMIDLTVPATASRTSSLQAQAESTYDGGRHCDRAAGAQAEEARAVAC